MLPPCGRAFLQWGCLESGERAGVSPESGEDTCQPWVRWVLAWPVGPQVCAGRSPFLVSMTGARGACTRWAGPWLVSVSVRIGLCFPSPCLQESALPRNQLSVSGVRRSQERGFLPEGGWGPLGLGPCWVRLHGSPWVGLGCESCPRVNLVPQRQDIGLKGGAAEARNSSG